MHSTTCPSVADFLDRLDLFSCSPCQRAKPSVMPKRKAVVETSSEEDSPSVVTLSSDSFSEGGSDYASDYGGGIRVKKKSAVSTPSKKPKGNRLHNPRLQSSSI